MKPMRVLLIAVVLMAARGVPAQPVTYESRHVERMLPGCGDEKEGCARVELDFVEITGGAAPEALDRMNQAIVDNLVRGGPKMTPDQYADRFIANYTVEDNPRGVPWRLERKIKALRATPPVVSLESYEFGYTGGAHPYSGTVYLNFNAATGKPVKLSDILRDGALPKLTDVAEGYFRRKRNLAPGADLKEEGFSFFKNDRFALNENFGVGEDALVFTFNEYEVAPYAWGPTEFEIPFSAIRDLLRPESGL